MSEYNRTHMAGEKLRKKSNREVGNLMLVVFPSHSLLKIQWDIGHIALPKASTRCQVFRTLRLLL
jgi:hypothetical protein